MDRLLKTIDGRQISFKLSGNPNGTPVVLLHGMGASASFTDPMDMLFRSKNIFAISIDRPGTAESSAFEKDVFNYIDLLHKFIHTFVTEPFMLIGWSAGGFYAQVYAIRYSNDISHLSLVSSAIPFLNKNAKNLLPFKWKALMRLSQFFPGLSERIFKKTAKELREDADAVLQKAMKLLSSPDHRIASDPFVYSLFKKNALESYGKEGNGPIFDARNLSTPQEIPLSEIKTPTHIWHGLRDSILPVYFAHYLHSDIKGSTVFEIPGQGHFLYLNFMEKIIERAKIEKGQN